MEREGGEGGPPTRTSPSIYLTPPRVRPPRISGVVLGSVAGALILGVAGFYVYRRYRTRGQIEGKLLASRKNMVSDRGGKDGGGGGSSGLSGVSGGSLSHPSEEDIAQEWSRWAGAGREREWAEQESSRSWGLGEEGRGQSRSTVCGRRARE